MMRENAIFIEKEQHARALREILRKNNILIDTCDIYALRVDIETILQEMGIKFLSARPFRNLDYQNRMRFSEDLVTEIIESPSLHFWQHRNISLGFLNRISAQDYFVQFLYWFDIVSTALKSQNYKKVIVLQEPDIDDSSKALSNYKRKTLGTIIHLCATYHQYALEIIMVDVVVPSEHLTYRFVLKQKLFSLFISVLNLYVRITHKPKEITLLISDIWRNFQPYLQELPEAEVILWERSEIFKIGWRNIFKYRMRFMHADVYRTKTGVRHAKEVFESVKNSWILSKADLSKKYLWEGYDLTNHILDIFEELIFRTYGDVLLIEDTFGMLERIKPNAVLVRASASTQLHFPVLCLVAKQLNIPSIEAQHGLFYLGPSSVPKFSTSSIMASYGPLASHELLNIGYKGRCLDIGSPRFDVYTRIKKSKENEAIKKVLVVLPDDTTGVWFDSYDVVDLLRMIKSITDSDRTVRFVIKARPFAPSANFGISSALAIFDDDTNVSIEIFKSIDEIFSEGIDAVVSVFSTILIETIVAKIPLIYLANSSFHRSLLNNHMYPYINGGGIDFAESGQDLINKIIEISELKKERAYMQNSFAENNFTILEGSSKRFSKLIKDVAFG